MHTCALRENNNVFLLTQHFYLVDEVSIVLNPLFDSGREAF